MEVTFAVVGDPSKPLGQGLVGPGGHLDASYADLPKVSLEVQETETLGQAISRACERLEVELPWEGPAIQGVGFIDFYREDRPPRLNHEVTILDSDGRVEWVGRWKNVPYGDLVRAGDAGVLVGDPRRPYLFLQPEIGNGVIVTLLALYGAWKLAWNIFEGLEKDVERARRLRDAARRLLNSPAENAGEVVQTHYEAWQRNGARPDNLARFLGDHPWTLDHLASVLGCSEDEAEALLLGFGHERAEDGRWHPGESQEAKFLRDTITLLSTGGAWEENALRRVLEERAEQYLETGVAPEIDWERTRDLPYDQQQLEEINEEFREVYEERERRWGSNESA